MQLDQNMLNQLLTLSDRDFEAVIRSLAKEAGLDPAALPLTPEALSAIRLGLRNATPEDLGAITAAFENRRNN